MWPKCFFKLGLGEPSALGKHGHVIVPPSACGAPELLGCKSCLVPIIVRVQGELGLDGPEPAICFQWLIRLMEERWLGSQKLRVSWNRWQVMMFKPLRSALLHNLPEECRLLVASGEHGRNCLGQIRRVRGCYHSVFNHDKISSIIQFN